METKYSYVKNQVKSLILQGSIQPHQRIGSENSLMKEYNVSRHTIRRAIDDLVNDGWIYKKQGSGTFCSDRTVEEQELTVKKKNIALITTYFSDYIFPTIIRGAERFLSDHGYQVTIFSTNNDLVQEQRCLETILTEGFAGVIVEPTKSALPNPNINYYLNFERLSVPYVMINAYYEEIEPVHVIMDDIEGGKLQAEHLLELGHRKILGFFKNDDVQGIKRMKGFIKAHREKEVTLSPQNIITYTTNSKDTTPHETLRHILSTDRESVDAIVCYNDQIALQLVDVIRELDLKIPEDISIVGFDDSSLAVLSEVKLTTIRHPQEKMGIKAGEIIKELVEDPPRNLPYSQPPVVFPAEIVVRSSTQHAKGVKVAP